MKRINFQTASLAICIKNNKAIRTRYLLSDRFLALFLILFLFLIVTPWQKTYAHAGHGTSSDDSYWAELAKDYPPYKIPGLSSKNTTQQKVTESPKINGAWSEIIEWPHVAVSAASLPDGRILTFSSYLPDKFTSGSGKEFTYAATWDPKTGTIIENNHPSHDLFAAHLSFLEDGRLILNGGNTRTIMTSFYNFKTDQWTKGASMNRGRWYPTTVALPNNTVFTALGTAGGQYPELWKEGEGWKVLTGINLQKPILDYNHYEREWWPLFHVDPRGKIFHSGPTPKMHSIDAEGLGSIQQIGPEIHDWYPKHGVTIMYDEGKLLVAGGAIAGGNQKSTNKAMIIDINAPTPIVTPIDSMKYARKFHNGVILPNGEVLVVGGNTSGLKFRDLGTILPAEIWNPDTRKWRTVASISVPRNYHSVALLLKDGRVFSSGSGLCACAADHLNTQLYTPPYLYDDNGNLAPRPVINNAPDTIKHGQTLTLESDNDINKFTLIKMSSTTHAINTDLRFLKVAFNSDGNGEYHLTMHANKNILTPGYWMLFAINTKGVPSEAKIIQIKTQGSPKITQLQDQAHLVGSTISVKISATDPNQETLYYSAENLPQGLSIDSSSGKISGTVNTEETKNVTVTIANSDSKNAINFEWKVYPRGKVAGVSYEYFINNTSNNWQQLPNLSQLTVNETGVVDNIKIPAIALDHQENSINYIIRLSTQINIEDADKYTFFLKSKNGSKLWVNNTLLIDNDGLHDTQEKQASIFLSEGTHTLTLVYFNHDDNGLLELHYQGAGFDKKNIPNNLLVQSPLHNVAPKIQNNIEDQTLNVNSNIDLSIIANDANGDNLHYSAINLPTGVQINASTGQLFGIASTIGDYDSQITVTDNHNENDRIEIKWHITGALSVEPIIVRPRAMGQIRPYKINTNGGINNQYKWDFGDDTQATNFSSKPSIQHTFNKPGRFTVTVSIITEDADGEQSTLDYQFIQPIFIKPPSQLRPAVSMSLAYDKSTTVDRLWTVNPDNNTVTSFNTVLHTKITEIAVGKHPRSVAKKISDGTIWVVNKDSATISIIDPDQQRVIQEVILPRASQPYGLIFSPADHFAYVTLQATNKLIQIDSNSKKITKTLNVGSYPRHLSISANGKSVYISRYITPPLPSENSLKPQTEINGKHFGGELIVVDTNTFSIKNTIILKHSEQVDSERKARGIPNYLGSVALSPDGLTAWIPSKQDNIKRGSFRDKKPLTHDSVVRSISSRIDLKNEIEQTQHRVDHDNAGIASAAIHSKRGSLVYVALEGSQEIEVIDAYNSEPLFRFDSGGHAPQGLILSPDGLTLFAHNFMDRTVTVFDLHNLVYSQDNSVLKQATYNLVENEILTPDILRGKQLFYDSKDERLSREQYSSCAQCHNEGATDGRVWDMGNMGEGLRNTISLIGHGDKNGPLHWSGNFDEVHDFEIQIRQLSGGIGFLSDTDFDLHRDPMGTAKQGLSEDLDSLAKYVKSLNKIPDSPYKNTDGSLTNDAKRGEKLFIEKGCHECHSGTFFTDSAKDNLHDIGTIKSSSGKRLGGQLTGINTPTLQGLWMTAPYLHDGSAKTLQDAIKVMRDKFNQPIVTTAQERDLLTAYLMQIDSNTAQPRTGNTEDNTNSSSNQSGGGSFQPTYLFLMMLMAWFRTQKQYMKS